MTVSTLELTRALIDQTETKTKEAVALPTINCHSFTLTIGLRHLDLPLIRRSDEIKISHLQHYLFRVVKQYSVPLIPTEQCLSALILLLKANKLISFHVTEGLLPDAECLHSGLIAPQELQLEYTDIDCLRVLEREASSDYATYYRDFSCQVGYRTLMKAVTYYRNRYKDNCYLYYLVWDQSVKKYFVFQQANLSKFLNQR